MNRRHLLAGVGLGGLLAACARDSATEPLDQGGSGSARPATGTTSPSESASGSTGPDTPTPTPSAIDCRALAESMSLDSRCGQLLMVGLTDPRPAQDLLDEWAQLGIGFALVLGDRVRGRVAMAALASRLSAVNQEFPLVVAVDQEGGRVQRLTGKGFSTIPSAVEQSTMAPDELFAAWRGWGKELARAGVLWNLAPCADVVPADRVAINAPIGQLRRHYGTTAQAALPSIRAALTGMEKAGVASSLKHFPGLGQVRTNTDYGEAVDTVTGVDSPELEAFSAALGEGVGSVMVSSAVHTRIDPDHRAVFSRAVITDLLRGRFGHQGVVVSDDLGAAAAVAEVPPGERATRFVDAGGDVVICADPTLAATMVAALVERAAADPAFAERVTQSAARALALKASVGALTC